MHRLCQRVRRREGALMSNSHFFNLRNKPGFSGDTKKTN
jgi:hypothetical protein